MPYPRFSKHQAHPLKPAARKVRSRNTGSVARRVPSANMRAMCASVIRANTVPVMIKYAFTIDFGEYCVALPV